MMEKRVPNYNLNDLQALVRAIGIHAFSQTARANAFAMGLSQKEMVATVVGLKRSDFYKSMTSYHDHTLWQDVYVAVTSTGRFAYIKVSDPHVGRPVIQFKEK